MNFRGALPSILGLLKAFQWNMVGFIHWYDLESRDVIAGLEHSDRGEICIELTEQSVFEGRKLINKLSSSKSNVTLVMDETALYYMSMAGQEETHTMEKHIIYCCSGVTFGLAGLEYKIFQGIWFLHQRPRLVPGFLDYLLDTNTHQFANATVGYLFRKVCHQCTANSSAENPCRNFNSPVPVNISAARLSHHEPDTCLGAPASNMCNLCLDRLAYLDVIFIMDLFVQKLARAIEELSQNYPPSQPPNSSDFNRDQLEQFLIANYAPLLPVNPNPFEVFYWNVTDDGEVKLPQLDVDVEKAASDSYDPVARTVGLRGGGAIRILPSHCSRSCGRGEVQKLHPDLPQHCCYACEVCSPGTYSNGSALESCWSCPQDEWSHGGQASCWKKAVVYLFWSEPTSIMLIMLTLVGMALTVSVTALYVKHIDTPIGKAAGGPIFYCHMASLLGSFASVFLFVGEPTGWKCRLRRPAFGVSFALCLASILAKCVRILAAFAAPAGRPTKLQTSLYLIVLGVLPALQCIICF
ncbi:taste 1 receptor member 2, partial [Chelydra serpentina]